MTLIFDVSTAPFTAWHAALPFLGVAIACAALALIARKQAHPDYKKRPAWLFGTGGAVAGLIFISLTVSTYRQYRTMQSALSTGAVTVTEGLVEEFSPQRRDHQSRETFRVGDVHFSVSADDISSAYTCTQRTCDVLREGMPVRIHSNDGQILRLEADTTAGEPGPTSPAPAPTHS